MCGVVGIVSTHPVNQDLYNVLTVLQHRGQDSAGIVTWGEEHGLKQLKDPGLKILNELSQVGGMMIRYGVTFGTSLKDFSEADMTLIAEFMKGTYTNEYLSSLR